MPHLSIRNICARNVDHTKKMGCRIAERLHLSVHGVRWIRRLEVSNTLTAVGDGSGLRGEKEPESLTSAVYFGQQSSKSSNEILF